MTAFANVVGHEPVREHLHAALVNHTLSHAYLFEGIAGVGKMTMAKELIRALLCTGPQADHMACGRCLSCRTIDSGNHPDVIEIDRGDKTSIGVDVIRDRLVHDVSIPPYQSSRKVYVIRDADLMSAGAQNALLKTLEEPPAYVLILLIARSSENFLPTVLSRVIRLRFQPLPADLIADELARREGTEPEQVSLIASLSQGSLGMAQELLHSAEFNAMRRDLAGLMAHLPEKNEAQLIGWAEMFDRYKERKEQLLDLMLIWIRDLLICRTTGGAPMMRDAAQTIRFQAGILPTEELLRMFSAVRKVQEALRQGAQYAFAVDCLLMNLAG